MPPYAGHQNARSNKNSGRMGHGSSVRDMLRQDLEGQTTDAGRRNIVNDEDEALRPRTVGFGKVEIVEFLPTLGDNPSVSSGVPIMLSERVIRKKKTRLDKFEKFRRHKRRELVDLVLERHEREDILLSVGVNHRDIVTQTRQCRKARNERENSYYNMHWDKIHERIEGTMRLILRMVGLRSSTKTLWMQVMEEVHETHGYVVSDGEEEEEEELEW